MPTSTLSTLTLVKEKEVRVRGKSIQVGDVASVKRRIEAEVDEYVEYLKSLESRLGTAPASRYLPEILPAFTKRSTGVMERCERISREISDKRIRKLIKAEFRKRIALWTKGNPFVERCLTKPRGYAGDYLMMELGYQNAPNVKGGLSGVFDRYFMDQYQCIESRKNRLKDYLRECIKDSTRHDSTARILTLGGGPAREWFELDRELRGKVYEKCAMLWYLDQDSEAMSFARARLKANGLLLKKTFCPESLFSFSRSPSWEHLSETFDLVYGLGIADYFYDQVLIGVIQQSFRLLRKGGRLVITHKDRCSFPFQPADWLCDWTFVRRDEKEFSELCIRALTETKLPYTWDVEREESREILFGVATKL